MARFAFDNTVCPPGFVEIEWRRADDKVERWLISAVAYKVIKVMDEWFWAIENGTAQKRRPDPQGQRYTEEEVDAFIKGIDDEFEHQINSAAKYHAETGLVTKGKPIDLPPEFNRLKGASREAFMQAIKKAKQEAIDSLA
jgi:hypothetical protein